MLEKKKGKPSPDLGAAVVYLERHGAPQRPLATEIALSGKEFVPRVIAVPVGSAVRFTNHDPFDHNVFSVSEPTSFDLGQYGRGEAKQWTFTAPGLVRVYCNVHPRMVAFVHVMATRHYTQPAADGTFMIADVTPGEYTLHVWHERTPEVMRELAVPAAGVSGLEIELDARGFRWVAHKNKLGEDYFSDAGRDRY
jgi:plastocyanin